MVSINLNFSNKAVYLLIGIFSVLIIAGFVIALGTVPNPGHAIAELQTCGANQTLIMSNGVWTCGSGLGGTLSCITSAGIPKGSSGDSLCASTGTGYACTAVSAADMGVNSTFGSSAATCAWISTTAGSYKANCCKVV